MCYARNGNACKLLSASANDPLLSPVFVQKSAPVLPVEEERRDSWRHAKHERAPELFMVDPNADTDKSLREHAISQ